MTILRKVLVALAWIAGTLAGICVLLYLVMVAVNWRDAEVSPTALRMADLHRNRPAVRDEDNAFVYLMGFGVAPGESPLEMGRKRIEWLRQSEGKTPLDNAEDPLGEPPDHRDARHPRVSAYFEACSTKGSGCSEAFAKASERFEEWKGSEEWLVERYRDVLTLPSWREFVPTDVASPLPPYGLVMDGQRLLLLHARIRAAKRDAAGVRELLGEDLRFWRRVLESSELLISKMIATAAVKRHFKLGAEVLRDLPPEHVSAALPEEWRSAITDAERTAQWWTIGEWMFASSMIRDLEDEMADVLPTGDSIAGTLLAKFGGPHFQPQDTINRYADFYSRVNGLLEGVPLAEYEAAVKRVTELAEDATRKAYPPRSLYNIPGRMIVGYGADYGSHARRVGDIEGVRRAALAAIELHVAQVARGDVPAALAASPLRNPYSSEPFAWDPAEGVVIFRGLESGDRGEHWIH